MKEENVLKEKRITLLTALINKIKVSIATNKIPRENASKTYIYSRLADYTYYSEVSIRKFLTGSIPKDISSFLNGIIKYSKLVKLDEEYINMFVKEYTESCNSVILSNVNNLRTKTNMPIQNFSSIIRTEKLTNFLNSFIEEDINISYIYGYKLSGKTKSVMAYLYDIMNENIYENIIWLDLKKADDGKQKILDTILMFASDEASNIEDEFKEKICENFLKTSKTIIAVDVAETKMDKEMLSILKILSTHSKIIIISSVPFEKYEEELLFISKKFSIIGFMSKKEFTDMLYSNKEFIPILTNNEEFVDKVYKLTGGFPFATLYIFKKIIEANRYGESLNDIIKNYSEYKEDEYEILASNIISEIWEQMSELSKKILAVCAKFEYSVSFKLVAKLCNISISSNEWKNALDECYDKDFLNHIISNNPRLNMNNLIRTLINSRATKEKIIDNEDFFNILAKYYVDLSEYIGECYNEVEKLKILDELDEFDIVIQSLNMLYETKKYKEYITIVRNLKYYIYVRGKWEKGETSIHLKRAKVAQIIGDREEELEAYCDYINIMSKSKNTAEAEKYLEMATKIKNTGISNRRILCLYNHVKALYLYNCVEKYNEAYELWEYNEKNYFEDISEYRRLVNNLWSNRCYLKLEKDLNKVVELFKVKSQEMIDKNFIRAAIDYELLLVAVLIKQYSESFNDVFLEEAEQWIYKVEEMLKNQINLDIRNEASFYKLKSLIYAYKKDNEDSIQAFEKACELYKMMNCNKDIEMLKYELEKIEEAN